MRKICVAFATILLLVTSVGATAGGYGYRHHGGYGNYGYHGGGDAGYFVGGLLLGTLLSAPRYAPPPRVVYVPQVAYAVPRVSYVQPSHAVVARRLLRDINGNCFERKIDGRGTEMRIQLPAAECAW